MVQYTTSHPPPHGHSISNSYLGEYGEILELHSYIYTVILYYICWTVPLVSLKATPSSWSPALYPQQFCFVP